MSWLNSLLTLAGSLWSWLAGRQRDQEARRAAAPAEAALAQDEHAQEVLRKAEETGERTLAKPLDWEEMNRP